MPWTDGICECFRAEQLKIGLSKFDFKVVFSGHETIRIKVLRLPGKREASSLQWKVSVPLPDQERVQHELRTIQDRSRRKFILFPSSQPDERWREEHPLCVHPFKICFTWRATRDIEMVEFFSL